MPGSPGTGLVLPAPFNPFAANSICFRDVEGLAVIAGSTVALKVANQINYSNPNYAYKAGGTAPEFYGYSGLGVGAAGEGDELVLGIESSVPTLIIAPAGAPTQKVTYVNEKLEPRGETAHEHLQAGFDAVPVPQLWRMPSQQLVDLIGTDKNLLIYQPSTDSYWEMWHFKGEEGAYTFQNGGFVENCSTWDGIFYEVADKTGPHGVSASSIGMLGGLLLTSDIARVLGGGRIGHCLRLAVPVATDEFLAPATKGQAAINRIPEKVGTEMNPAWEKDAVPIGVWLRFPPGSTAAEHGLTDPMSAAVYEAIREYGLLLSDGGGSCELYGELPVPLGSEYSQGQINPYAGASSVSKHYEFANIVGYAARTNPALPLLTKPPGKTSSFLFEQPWQLLEQLEPRVV
jgi:hypothetical protein